MAAQNNTAMFLPTDRFSWDGAKKQFSGEASTIGLGCFQRIYPDAADVGCLIQSHTTHKCAWFYLDHQESDREGDTMWWELKPTAEAIKQNPGLANVTVIIYND